MFIILSIILQLHIHIISLHFQFCTKYFSRQNTKYLSTQNFCPHKIFVRTIQGGPYIQRSVQMAHVPITRQICRLAMNNWVPASTGRGTTHMLNNLILSVQINIVLAEQIYIVLAAEIYIVLAAEIYIAETHKRQLKRYNSYAERQPLIAGKRNNKLGQSFLLQEAARKIVRKV